MFSTDSHVIGIQGSISSSLWPVSFIFECCLTALAGTSLAVLNNSEVSLGACHLRGRLSAATTHQAT